MERVKKISRVITYFNKVALYLSRDRIRLWLVEDNPLVRKRVAGDK